jgi:hypothetical protein
MVQNVELTFPKAESHLVEQTGLDTWCGNRGGDGSCTEAGFDRSADRLVRWQLQADAQRAEGVAGPNQEMNRHAFPD